MKITRSALKSLIKEEMNRILTVEGASGDPRNHPGGDGDRVAGDDVAGEYAFEKMEASELSVHALAAYKGRSDRFKLEGLGGLKIALLKAGDVRQNNLRDVRGTRFAMSLEGRVVHAKTSIPDRLPGNSYREYNDTMDRTGYVQLSVLPANRDATDGSPVWSEESKAAVVKFNGQNAGLGGILTDNSNGKFNFSDGPSFGMNFTIKLS
jgi:hypothetical protein